MGLFIDAPHEAPTKHPTSRLSRNPAPPKYMILNHNSSPSNFLARTSVLLCASVAVVAMALVSGEGAVKATVNVPVLNANQSLVLDAGAFGSSAGQASFKAAPTTWSSRSNVRWNARWASEGRYVV